MDNQSRPSNQIVANILRQQPTNLTESINPKPTLDQRIQTIQSMATQATITPNKVQKPTQSLFQKARTAFQKSTNPQSLSTQTPLPPPPKESTSSRSTNEHSLPILQLPKKSTLSFMERFKAQHNNHNNPEYYKVATIPCGQDKNKTIPIYRFTDEKRAYETAEEYGKNQYKFNGRFSPR